MHTFAKIRTLEHSENFQSDTLYQIKLISWISLGLFLFVLFFHPFDYNLANFNDHLIFVLGLSFISFLIMMAFRILMPISLTSKIRSESLKISNEVGLIMLIWFFITVGNICYLFFVGKIDISLSEGVKISLFSSLPSIILKLADVNMTLRNQLRSFVRRNVKLEKELAAASHPKPETVVFMSDSGTEKLELLVDDIMMIRSADNYVDVYFRKEQKAEHKLLRNTLKNIEQQLRYRSDFLRCHRSTIINTSYILNMTNSYKGHRLIILDMDEEIPVSRQYLLAIKEALAEQ